MHVPTALRFLGVVAGMVIVWPAAALARQAAPPFPPGRIVGRVVDLTSGAALPGVRLVVSGLDRTVVTDGEGRFAIDLPAPGRYELVARADGFLPTPPVTVTLTPDEPVAHIDVPYRLVVAAEAGATAEVPVGPVTATAGGRTLLDARAIQLATGALEDPYRVLQVQPGAAPSTDDRNDVLVRGGGAIETATRIDGFDVPNPSHFAAQGGSGGGLSMVSPWVVEHASFEPGGFSVQHGERASSVVEIAVRSGNRQRLAGTAGIGVGGVMALAEGPFARGQGGWLASVRRSFLELVFERGDSRAVPRFGDVLVKVDGALGSRHRVATLALGGIDDVDAASSRNQGDILTDHQRIGLAGMSLASRWSASTMTAVFVSFGTNEIDARTYDDGRPNGVDRSTERELRVRAEVRRQLLGRHDVVGGVAVKRAWLSFDLQAGSWRNGYGNLVPALRSVRDDRLTEAGAYAEVATRVTADVAVTGGFRVDRAATTGRVLGSPRVRAEWAVGPRVSATVSWGIYRQVLPYIWLGSHPANRLLDPIASRQVTVGGAVRGWGNVRMTVEGFDKRYRQYPVDPVAPARVLLGAAADFESPFVGALTGTGRVHARGIDVAAAVRAGHRLDATFGYAWWHVTQAGLDGIWRPADYDLRHQGRVGLRWIGGARWSVGAAWRYAAGRPYTPYDPVASVKAGGGRYDRTRINALRYPPYHRLDVRGDWRLATGRVALIFYAELNNAYDRDNLYLYDWNRRTRTSDPTYQWGRMPVAGLRVEF